MKRRFSILKKIVGLLVLLLVLVGVLIQTPTGKEMLAAGLSRALSNDEGGVVHVGRVSGWVPARTQIDVLVVSDAQGAWLVARNLQGRWILSDLLRGRIRLKELRAEEIELIRLPRIVNRQKDGGSGRLGRMNILLEQGTVERLLLGQGAVGVALEYAVHFQGVVLADGRLSGDVALAGDAVGAVGFSAVLVPEKEAQISVRGKIDEIRKPASGMEQVSVAWEATVASGRVQATVEADLKRDGLRGTVASRLTYAAGRLQLDDLSFSGAGWTAGGKADLVFSQGCVEVNVDGSLSNTNDVCFGVNGSGQVGTGSGTWWVNVSSLELNALDAVALSLSGRLDPQQVALAAELAEFDLGALPCGAVSNFAGNVSGKVTVSGSTAGPEVRAVLDVARFSTPVTEFDELPKLDYRVAAGISNGMVFASTSITNFTRGYLDSRAAMPCSFSLVPFLFEVDRDRVKGTLDAVLDLEVFNGLAMLDNQHVAGVLSAELAIDEGVPSGFIAIEEGVYEHYEWGVLFRDMDLRMEPSSDGFNLVKARATDGRTGRLKLSGGVKAGVWDMVLSLSEARVLRRPELQATVSGQLSLAGPLYHPAIAGSLVVDRADLLPDNMVLSRPTVLENYDATIRLPAATPRKTRSRFPLDLDIHVEMPDQVYVNASLLDMVWGGSLWLRNTQAGMVVRGRLEPRRGHINFIGRQFRLRDGSLDLDTSVQRLPVMNNLTAEYARSDISARLILNGRVDHPQCLLESSPAMPEDEILSHILFRRNASSITPYQAVQIAAAAQQLSSGLSGPGFLYQFRRAIGVDTFEIRESETQEGASSVAAGKYIIPELYVEVNSTFGAEAQTDLTAEYEIDRHFSIETSAGPKLRPGIGLNWRYDY